MQLTYLLCLIGAIAIIGLGIPFMERLVRRIWPLTPKQEEAHRFHEEARRRIDRFIR
jgi:hypothetical protein